MSGLESSTEKMREEGVGDAAVQAFADAYQRLEGGETGVLPEAELEPVDEVPDADELPESDARDALDQAVVIKLNGGLGTSMGMTGPKSLVEVKDGLTFLDVIVRQVLELRERTGARFRYLRMREPPYDDAALRALGETIGPLLDDGLAVYCYFRHEDEPTAPAYATRLLEVVNG